MKNTKTNYSPIPGFEWPDFKSERERIKSNSIKFKDEDVSNALAKFYKLHIGKVADNANAYRDVQPGEIITLDVKSVDKKNVNFDNDAFKENIISAVNLSQYARFKSGKPAKGVKCKVVSKDNKQIVVDPLTPIFDEWIKDAVSGIRKQYDITEDKSTTIKNLKLVKGGFQGDVEVKPLSEFCGQPMHVKAFIPGSQIVLNIERDFEQWEGKSVKAFMTNYSEASEGKNGLIFSVKEYLKFEGNKNKLEMFKTYCDADEAWNTLKKTPFHGVVTGIINSSKKQGVFVELPELNITGMIEMTPEKLAFYHPEQEISVVIDRIDEPMYMNEVVGQMQHGKAFIIEDNLLKKCNLRFVFKELKK